MACGCNKRKKTANVATPQTKKEQAINKTKTRSLPLVRTGGARIKVRPLSQAQVKK